MMELTLLELGGFRLAICAICVFALTGIVMNDKRMRKP